MIGWWHAYELTFGGHTADSASATTKPPTARADVQSLVVLPLVDESEKRDGDWFIDMLTSDLTAELSRMPSTLVISRIPRAPSRARLPIPATSPRISACAT